MRRLCRKMQHARICAHLRSSEKEKNCRAVETVAPAPKATSTTLERSLYNTDSCKTFYFNCNSIKILNNVNNLWVRVVQKKIF